MKIVIAHLSDIHFRTWLNLDYLIEPLEKAVFEISKPDVLFVAISGDIAFSGKKAEYKQATRFLRRLERSFSSQSIEVHFVFAPGNHDAHFGLLEKRDRKEIWEKVNSTNFNDTVAKELRHFKNYKSFISAFADEKLKSEAVGDSGLLNRMVYKAGDVNLVFYTLNGVFLSYFVPHESDKVSIADSDEGLARIPSAVLMNIKRTDSRSIVFLVSHYPVDYCTSETQDDFRSLFGAHIDAILSGHLHKPGNQADLDISKQCLMQASGALYEKGNSAKFSLLSLDTLGNDIFITSFGFESKNNLFVKDVAEGSVRYQLPIGLYQLAGIDQNFTHDLLTDPLGFSDSFLKYYSFPKLLISNMSEAAKKSDAIIKDFDRFFEKDKDYPFCLISGNEFCGKTLFLKKLFLEMKDKGLFPVFFSPSDIKYTTDKQFRSYFENIYASEYLGSPIDVYYQAPKENRYILFDGFSDVPGSKRSDLLRILSGYAGHVVLASDTYGLSPIFSGADLDFEGAKVLFLRVMPLTVLQRKEIAGKLYDVSCQKIGRRTSESERKTYISQVEHALGKPGMPILSTRSFDLLCKDVFDGFISGTRAQASEGTDFARLFRRDFLQRINKYSLYDKLDCDELIQVLSRIAFYANENKRFYISQKEYSDLTNAYCTEIGNLISSRSVLDFCLRTDVFSIYEDNPNMFRFSSSVYFSYFVAYRMSVLKNSRKIEEQKAFNDTFNSMLDQIGFGMNGTILLYLACIQSGSDTVNQIVEKSIKIIQSGSDIDITPKGIDQLIAQIIEDSSVESTKEDCDKAQEEAEINTAVDSISGYKTSAFEKIPEDSKWRDCLVSARFVDILASLLPAFSSVIDAELKNKCVSELYRVTDSLSFGVLQYFSDNIGFFKRLLKQQFGDDFSSFGKDQNENVIYGFLADAVLVALYLYPAEIASNDKTSKFLLDERLAINKRYEIQRLAFYSCCKGIDSYFLECQNLLKKYPKDVFVTSMVYLMIYVYLNTHEGVLPEKTSTEKFIDCLPKELTAVLKSVEK